MLHTRRAVVGRWIRVAAHRVTWSRTVVRSNGSMYWPRCSRVGSVARSERPAARGPVGEEVAELLGVRELAGEGAAAFLGASVAVCDER